MSYGLERWLEGRWIAGPTADDALRKAAEINKSKISVLINYLGEDLTRKADIDDAVNTYLLLIAKMAERRIQGDISIKATQIGLRLGQGLMKDNYARIMARAKADGIFVWLDMEEPQYVPAIIKTYLEAGGGAEGKGGICIQAYLKRSLEDVRAITGDGGIVRLVKGAYGYKEGTGMIKGRKEIGMNYREIMGYLFDHSQRFMIATHDMDIVREALALNSRARKNVTYAMLNGIKNGEAKGLAAERQRVALYLPFGTRWVGYSYRRLREIGSMRLILGSLLRSQQL